VFNPKNFTTYIKLELEIHAPQNVLDIMGDIDNYLKGVCDRLKPRPNNLTLKPHIGFQKPGNIDTSPNNPIFYEDDNIITSINGNKIEDKETYYIIRIYDA
jgi:Holliday junction resolvase RusA-like endonuclease